MLHRLRGVRWAFISLAALVPALSLTGPALARRIVFGHSVQGRPLVAWTYGSARASRRILVIGCIHGNECAGLAITSALRRRPVPRGVQLWLVPEANPDGAAAGTRKNADGVDLNRNFPYRWARTPTPATTPGRAPSQNPRPAR